MRAATASPPVFIGVVDGVGKLHLDARQDFDRHLAASLKNSRVELVIRKHRSRKSREQLGWYWGCILPMLSELTGYTIEELHEYLTAKFLGCPERKTLVIADVHGEVVDEVDVLLSPDRVRRLNTAEMATYCDTIRMWAASDLGLDIPEPDKRWKEKRGRDVHEQAA